MLPIDFYFDFASPYGFLAAKGSFGIQVVATAPIRCSTAAAANLRNAIDGTLGIIAQQTQPPVPKELQN